YSARRKVVLLEFPRRRRNTRSPLANTPASGVLFCTPCSRMVSVVKCSSREAGIMKERLRLRAICVLCLSCVFLLTVAGSAWCQERAADQGGIRGNRAEISITIKDGSSQIVGPLVTVKLYFQGALAGQMSTSKGRVVFILNRLGDYRIEADAVGYRSA